MLKCMRSCTLAYVGVRVGLDTYVDSLTFRTCSDTHVGHSDTHACCSDTHACCCDTYACCSDTYACCSDTHTCCDTHACCCLISTGGISNCPKPRRYFASMKVHRIAPGSIVIAALQ